MDTHEAGTIETDEPDGSGGPERPKAGGARAALIGMIAGAVLLGGAVGGMAIGPLAIGGRKVPHAERIATPAPAVRESHRQKGVTHSIDNIITNPAGSQGLHFLMVSIVLEVPDQAAAERLRENDVALRDDIITLIGSRTMETLSTPGARDALKREVAELAMPLAGPVAWMQVYIPEFVIQ